MIRTPFNLPPQLRIGATALLLLLLAACGTVTAPEANETDRFDLITDIAIDATTTRAELEAASGGSVVVFRPEAGFAIVAFQKGQGDLALMSTAEPNQDLIGTPEANANGWTAWSGGWTAWSGGWTAWSGGWTAWSGGWTAWSGGWTAWSGGVDTGSTFGENLLAWDQIKLPQGQLMAPNLGSAVKVAVIDTGVSLNHPAFAGRFAPSGEWMDYVDDDAYPMDEPGGNATGHGTAVAGVVLQVAPNVTILPIRVLAADGSGDVDDVVQGIDHAVAMGADVINLSLGTDVDLTTLKAMIDYATSQEVFVVASVGNEGTSDILYPARYAKNPGTTNQYLLSVGSVDQSEIKTVFSNFGVSSELFTPGEGIYTVTRNDTEEAGVTNATGTSFSAPMVTGAVTLALGESPTSVQRALIHTNLNVSAMDLEPGNPGYPGQIGYGQLDIEEFLTSMQYTAPSPTKSALLVLNTPIISTDQFIADRLELLGFDVTTVDDNAATSAMATGKDLVLISQTVSSTTVNTTFRDVAVPVITWEAYLYDDMNLSGIDFGNVDDVDSVDIATDHPLSVGFTGNTLVYQGLNTLRYGTPSSSAITVATAPGDASKAVIFAYEQGAKMVGMEAPAKRMGFFFRNDDVLAYDYRGVTLFDAAVLWSSYDGNDHFVASKTYLEAVNHSTIEGAFTTVAASDTLATAADTIGSFMLIPQVAGINYDESNTQGRMHYDLVVPVSGTYHVWLRVFGPDGSSDSFFVQMDDGSNQVVHFGTQNSWLWKKVSGSVSLDGNHTLTITHREGGARLDRILITSDATFTPSGLGGY